MMNRKKWFWTKAVAAITAFTLLLPAGSLLALADGANGASREESVYVNIDSQGNIKEETVSVWLHSDAAGATLTDKADLKDIVNVKGDETPQISGDGVTWKLDGNDLYYQGTTSKPLPVKVRLQYFLNGQQKTPADLAGKSGKFEMKVAFENLDGQSVTIGGAKKTVYLPLVCATAFNLPQKKFTNVKTNFGDILADGTNQMVSFVNVPGLKQSFDMVADYLDFPDELDITADVTDFELGPIMVLVSPLPDIDSLKDTKDLNDLLNKLDQLYDAGSKLKSATGQLSDGETQFADGVDQLYSGVLTAGSSFNRIVDGAKTLNGGAGKLTTLVDGVKALSDGAAQLFSGTKQLLAQFGAGSASNPTLKYSINALYGGAQQVSQGMGKLKGQFADGSASAPTLKYSVNALKGGAAQVSGGLQQLLDQFGSGSASNPTLKYSATALAEGTKSYVDSSNGLVHSLRGNADVYDAVLASLPGNPSLATALILLTGPAQMATTEAALGVSADDINKVQAGYSSGGNAIVAGSQALSGQMSPSGDAHNPSLYDAVHGLVSGAQQVSGGLGQLSGQLAPSGDAHNPSLYDAVNQLASGSRQVAAGAGQLNGQMKSGGNPARPTLYDGVSAVNDGARQVMEGLSTLVANASKLKELQSGVAQLTDALEQFQGGMGDLKDGASALQKSSIQLNDGSKALDDGMNKFWAEGLSKLHGADKDKLDEALAVKDELIRLADGYTSFSGQGGSIRSSVKFIVKADEIKVREQVSDQAQPVQRSQDKGAFARAWDWIRNLFHK